MREKKAKKKKFERKNDLKMRKVLKVMQKMLIITYKYVILI
jgi:hypothetical protein